MHFFSKNISVYATFNDQSFKDRLTNDIISFEQLGPDKKHLSHSVRKYTFGHVHQVMIQISLCIWAVWSESSLVAFWIAKDAKFLHVDNRRLICLHQ